VRETGWRFMHGPEATTGFSKAKVSTKEKEEWIQ
jgi:hypothetical protein